MSIRPVHTAGALIIVMVMTVVAAPVRAQHDPAAPVQMDTLEVIGVTPVGGAGVPLRQVPANVQSVSAEQLRALRPLNVTDALGASIGSLHLSNLGSNPFQPDVNYRGFRGSPLLGLPQGMSVYLDGTRVNETFGDVVNWDLIPEMALERIELLPGSNPAFGLNTLGGSLSLQTKSGFSAPGLRLQGYGGSHARLSGEGEVGGHTDRFGYYAAGRGFRENGWRDFSSSEVQTAFSKATWVGSETTVDASALYASSRLRGNGAVPVELLHQDRAAVFTHPDETSNDLGLFTVTATHALTRSLTISSTAYGRFTQTDTFNGDDSDYGACPSGVAVIGVAAPGEALCFGEEEDDAGEQGEGEENEARQVFDQNGDPVRVSDAVDSATQNTTSTRQRRVGWWVQARWSGRFFGRANRLVVGGQTDAGFADFTSQTELGRLTETRGTVGSGLLDRESFTEVETQTRTGSAYVVNTLVPMPRVAVTLSGRYTSSNVTLSDQLGTALNGDHTFNRFNPAAGITFAVRDDATAFANVSQSTRAPTPVELTCADENDPCRLPNGFQADPPLNQVVATTYSAGVRQTEGAVQASISIFRTVAADDIYFISAGPARNSGFFDNIGKTRRQGIELTARGTVSRVQWFAAYTYLDATFRESLRVNAPNHPEAEAGEIIVASGDRLPLTPRHIGKLGVDIDATHWLTVRSTALWQGTQYIRGDESNQLAPLDAFATLNAEATAEVYRRTSIFAKVDNVLNARYETAGLLGEPDDVDAFEDFQNPRFVTPGAPRMIRVGIAVAL